MRFGERVFYTSQNGDRWMLVTDDDIVSVRHLPNAASTIAQHDIDNNDIGPADLQPVVRLFTGRDSRHVEARALQQQLHIHRD